MILKLYELSILDCQKDTKKISHATNVCFATSKFHFPWKEHK